MSRRGGGGGGHNRQTTSLYVRNLHHECRQDDLRKIFSKYGEITDVYIPLDYHTRQVRGFAYIQFTHYEDAEDAVYYIDGTSLFGRALEVQIAQSDRKTPAQMRYRGGPPRRGRRSYSRSRSRSRSPRRGPPPRDRGRDRDRGDREYRGRERARSRTRSPRISRSKSASPPPRRSASGSPKRRSVSKSKSRSKSRSKSKSR